MSRILILFIILFISSCVVSESCCDKDKSVCYPTKTYYQPTKVVIIKKDKPIRNRSIKVKINKHRKRK